MTEDPSSPGITALLERWSSGDRGALDQLMPWVAGDLRRIAARQLGAERANHTLQPTALVNETFLRLVQQRRVHWRRRAQFFALAATLMRRILVDYARARGAAKRAGRNVTLDSSVDVGVPAEQGVDAMLLDDALRRLEAISPRQARIVELRFFSELGVAEVAAAMELSPATVKADWAMARAWLYREIGKGHEGKPGRRV